MKQLEYLCDVEHKNVVQEILCKWVMNAGCLDFKELYESIVNRYASMLEERKGELYIDGLFAMIINPGIVEKGWCIKREDFKKRQQELNSDFSTKNISFPTIGEPTEAETEGLGSSLFVEKLRIANLEREIARAIHDYVKTNNLIMREIKGSPVRDVGLEKYKDKVWCENSDKDTCKFSFAGVIWDETLQKYRGCNVVARAMRRVYNEREMIMRGKN